VNSTFRKRGRQEETQLNHYRKNHRKSVNGKKKGEFAQTPLKGGGWGSLKEGEITFHSGKIELYLAKSSQRKDARKGQGGGNVRVKEYARRTNRQTKNKGSRRVTRGGKNGVPKGGDVKRDRREIALRAKQSGSQMLHKGDLDRTVVVGARRILPHLGCI